MESEHVPVPQAEVAAPTAAPAIGGAVPLGPVSAPMTPSSVLALQRAAGNQAVTGMLQRQEATKEKTPVTGAGDFGVSGGAPQVGGKVTARPDGDGVRAESPDVKYQPAKVWLQEGKTLGGSQNFGFVQNLVKSTRGGVWRRGGDPNEEVTSNTRSGQGKAYDAVSDPNDDTKIHKAVFAPFYWPPGSINDENVAASPAETDPVAHDQPGFTYKAKDKDGGRLTEFVGADHFKLGVGVKKGDGFFTLAAWDWSVPWDMQVDKDLNGAGKAVTSKAVQDLLNDGPDTSLGAKDWSLRGGEDVFEGFATQADAMKRTPTQLLNWIHMAKQHDPPSYSNIVSALDAKAPGITVNINCDTTHVNFGKDTLSARVLRDGTLIKNEAGLSLNNGESTSLSLGWSEVFGSASTLQPGTVLKVELYVTKNNWEVGHGFMSPFSGTSPQLTPGDGRYKVSVSL